MAKVDIFILSGFLGSGKTTLLKNFLRYEQENHRKVAVVMNEVGQVSVDSDAIPKNTPLKELINGCVCCTIQDEFETQLHELLQEHELDVIVIETTGVAHPIEVFDACMSPMFAEKIEVRGIITLVDATRWMNRHLLSEELRVLLQEQIYHANIVVINKIDALSEAELSTITYAVQSINPSCITILTTYAQVNLEQLYHIKLSTRKSSQPAQLHKQLRIQSYVHTFTEPIDLEKFEVWLGNLPPTVYRIKGYLQFKHLGGLYSFQFANGMPIYMREEIKTPLNFVIIGNDLDKRQLYEQLSQLQS